MLKRKREEYERFINMHYLSDEEEEEEKVGEDENLKKIHKVIYFDVLRT